jgi:4-hydroxybenzoate polyprenyltransferase
MNLKTLFTLGRVSNLPTIWTNVLAAAILANTTLGVSLEVLIIWLGTLLALSLMYLGGMFLNDAFDADWDKKNHNLRPIVTGEIDVSTVWIMGGALMGSAVLMVSLVYQVGLLNEPVEGLQSYYGLFAGLALALTIIAYNAWHKRFAHSAFIMGACRFWVYLIGALLLAQLNVKVAIAALSLLLYIAGLTYLARHEQQNRITRLWPLLLLFTPVVVACYSGYQLPYFWLFLLGFVAWVVSRVKMVVGTKEPNVKACIGGLLAAIPLLDGLMLASVNAIIPSLICLMVFFTIPRLHRWVSGT